MSGRPVIFRQTRVGQSMHRFELLKLRSMGGGRAGASITVDRDDRITSVGRVLRKWKLDELPQLWNVLRGDMSLVGPRPEVPEWVEPFESEFAQVLRERPGITDLASIMYRDEAAVLSAAQNGLAMYANQVLPHKLHLSRLYIERVGLMLDLHLLVLTVVSLFAPRFASGRVKTLVGRLERASAAPFTTLGNAGDVERRRSAR
jgi:lipopolysaccharide/colanic/teichoic acid biosynthesis glycosyltransferase